MRSVLLSVLLVGVVGCSRASAPAPVPAATPASSSSSVVAMIDTPSSLRLDQPQRGWCPIHWTCDSSQYYSQKPRCEAVCGAGNCYLEPHCTAFCICQ